MPMDPCCKKPRCKSAEREKTVQIDDNDSTDCVAPFINPCKYLEGKPSDPVADFKKELRAQRRKRRAQREDAPCQPRPNMCLYPPIEKRMILPSEKYSICWCDPQTQHFRRFPTRERKASNVTQYSKISTQVVRLPSPINIRINDFIPRFKSPESTKESKVKPRAPSDASVVWPEDTPSCMDMRPEGIPFTGSIATTLIDLISFGYDRPYAVDLLRKYGLTMDQELDLDHVLKALEEEGEGVEDVQLEVEVETPSEPGTVDVDVQTEPEIDEEGKEDESVGTSMESPETVTDWVQKFHDESEAKKYQAPELYYKRKTLESHSLTDIKQPVVDEYQYGILLGSYDQGDDHFSNETRNKQTLGNLIVSYCFSFLKHPTQWTSQDVDNILEDGDKLYRRTIEELHYHSEEDEVGPTDLLTNIVIGNKRFLYKISEPLVVGLTKSEDPSVYNLTKAFTIFFKKYNCALLETNSLYMIVWKCKYYYIFDPKPRAKDLYPDPEGAAAIISFLNIKNIVSMLIERTVMKNWRFVIRNICVTKILDPDAPYDTGDEVFDESNEYRILGDSKAVITGSFSMADPCFDWTATKQAVSMCVIALVYSKITPSASWCKKILDKVILLGNELHFQIAVTQDLDSVNIDNIPADFTLGPFRVSISILLEVIKGYMFSRKKYPSLESGVKDFFDHSSSGIVQFSKFTYAIWKQRDFYYMFDPYQRDFEGYLKRNGTAILTMHNCLDSLRNTLMMNVDKDDDCVFVIHALKETRIVTGGDDIRPARTMQDKSKMPMAQQKPVCIDTSAVAGERFPSNTTPSESDLSVSSSVGSLDQEYVPAKQHDHIMPSPKPVCNVSRISIGICDLDSPSLSDTQIVPPRPEPQQLEDQFSYISDEVYSMTTLLDILVPPEDQPFPGDLYIEMYDFEKRMIEELRLWYDGEGEYEMEEVPPLSTDEYVPKAISAMTMTEGFQILKRRVWRPPRLPEGICGKKPPFEKEQVCLQEVKQRGELTLEEELERETNFLPLPDGSEIITGQDSLLNYDKIQIVAPFVVIMAIVVAHKYAFVTWDSGILDYIIECGRKLQEVTPQRFDEAAVHEFLRVVLGSKHYKVKAAYILDSVFKPMVMEKIITTLFKRCSRAIIVNPNYSCAIFYKNSVYYLYDPYNSNITGLGQGPDQPGTVTFMRFTSCHQLVARIIHNKCKREMNLGYTTTRYVLSVVEVHHIPPDEDGGDHEPMPDQTQIDIEQGLRKVPIEPPPVSGYQETDEGLWVIYGNMRLHGKTKSENGVHIKECHFCSLTALLLLMYHPIDTWDSQLVDKALDVGTNIFEHAEHKEFYQKRVVNNLFLEKKFFDLIITALEFPLTIPQRNMRKLLDYYLLHRNFLLLQFPTMCMGLYVDDDFHHLFDPYKYKKLKARWTRFTSRDKLIQYINKNTPCSGNCTYYTFAVTSIRNAPKKATIKTTLTRYEKEQRRFKEQIIRGKPLDERQEWLCIDPIPWTRLECKNAAGQCRGNPDSMWKEWEVEHPNDLWSLWSNLHQRSSIFTAETRGRQTLCNCVIALLFVSIYELCEWNPVLLDSILKNGDQYYIVNMNEKLENDDEPDEPTAETLKPDLTVPPFTATVQFVPIVCGTMYLISTTQFNLYRALAYFFNNVDQRFGLIFNSDSPTPEVGGKSLQRRVLAFGKIREAEYFMYDCQWYGPPLFLEKQGCSYILRMTSLNRLVHCMTLTLREGDFYIYEVIYSNIKEEPKTLENNNEK